MADCCSNFASLEEFLEHGIGYVIVHNGEIISGASSYSYCEGSIEITIGTKKEFRRKGLALAVASKLIVECMERNIYPAWDAANLESVALAEKLGYHFDKAYEVYSI
ncbi:GNAT acetyltransferase [Clostridium oryzae]|uniref:GNAT acetyltransferase n=2 Tax=Clostridium oryzae TaxID=1450648 RepID=A0A1V4IX84_9CLOT|nr:GNAT acetyltransferase [Clostridium oryzae]